MTIMTLQEMAAHLRIHPLTLARRIRHIQAKRGGVCPGVFFIGPKVWGYRIEMEVFLEVLKEEAEANERP